MRFPESPTQVVPTTALLLVNQSARRGNSYRVDLALRELQAHELRIIQHLDCYPDDFSRLIQVYQSQVDLVIVAGGDGTLNSAIEGLVKTRLPLGILPLGTANDLARTLGISLSVPEACRTIAEGHQRWIDLGWVNGKHFFNVASLGLSVRLTQKLTNQAKKRWGILAYGITALRMLNQTQPFHAAIMTNGIIQRVKTLQIAVGNGRHYGGGMTIAHDATIDDARLDLYSLEIQHWWQVLTIPIALRWGRYGRASGIRVLSGAEFEIQTAEPCLINTDGELSVWTPARFQVIPKAISVIVPRN